MLIANVAQPLQERRWRGDIAALSQDGLDEDGGRVSGCGLLQEQQIQLMQRLLDQLVCGSIGRQRVLMPIWERD